MIRRFGTIHAWLGGGRERAEMTALAAEAGREILFLTDRELDERIGDIEVLLCGVAPRAIDGSGAFDWSRAKSLVLLQMLGSGTDSLWPATGLPSRVLVANTRGVHVPEMRDHGLALILGFERDLFRFGEQQRSHEWATRPTGTIHGKTLAIIGLGVVGHAIAEAASALGMRVISAHASAPYDLAAMLAQADYAVVLVPLTPKTRGMIGPRELAGMKNSAVLIVMSRGGIVDESALGAALRANALRGAALDVFDEEPLPKTSPVWDTPRLVITPHVAGLTHDYIRRVTRVALDNVARIERGEPPTTLISAARGY